MARAAWQWAGGVAVVTGAAGGIGAALAAVLAGRGMHLALVDRDPEGLAASAAQARQRGVTVSGHTLDLLDSAATAALLPAVLAAHSAPVTVLVNNAGMALGGRFDQVQPDDFDALMRVNFGAVVQLCRAFLPVLQQQPAAQIVNVSSLFGLIAPPGQTAYCASKFAVRGFSESLRHELQMANAPVGVTLVHPGGVRTGIAAHARVAPGASAADVAREQAAWQRLLRLSPEAAATQIADALGRRDARVLVGRDAVQGAWLQRLMPVGYWRVVARDIARRVQRGG